MATIGNDTTSCVNPTLPQPIAETGQVVDDQCASLAKQSKVMIIDDEPTNIKIVKRLLELESYSKFVTLKDSRRAIELVQEEQPDVVLLDLMMPHVGGLEVLEQIRANDDISWIPVIILTAICDQETRFRAVELGATDFLNKPVEPSELIPRVRNVLTVKNYQDQLRNYSRDLESAVRQRTAELEASRRDVIHCLARAAEYRDDDTGHHVIRVGRYAAVVGEAMGMDHETVDMLEQAAQLHDIGKIGIPDAILLKPGKLTDEEFFILQKHSAYGKRILQRRSDEEERKLTEHAEMGSLILEGATSPVLDMARTIALTHHEWWNGSGYPLGLKGEDIPLVGRITAVADVFDALSTRRCYKKAFPIERCFEIMEEERDTHFDPTVLDAFFSRHDEVVRIQIRYADES